VEPSAGQYFVDKTLNAYKNLRSKMDLDLLVALGPSLAKLESNNPTYRNIGFVSNLHEYIYASDLVLSLAGRSTIDESRVYGTPGYSYLLRITSNKKKMQGSLVTCMRIYQDWKL
jgi:UDP-N-acetylglucosamine--N-acetylmuramyl-(pentapeptide) pyrophosphoryl-undecaprenol N-acetylglucosamine transferase